MTFLHRFGQEAVRIRGAGILGHAVPPPGRRVLPQCSVKMASRQKVMTCITLCSLPLRRCSALSFTSSRAENTLGGITDPCSHRTRSFSLLCSRNTVLISDEQGVLAQRVFSAATPTRFDVGGLRGHPRIELSSKVCPPFMNLQF